MKEHPLIVRNVVPVRYVMASIAGIPRDDIRARPFGYLSEKKVDGGHCTVDVSMPSSADTVPLELSALLEVKDFLQALGERNHA